MGLALDLTTTDSPLGVVAFGCGSCTTTCQDDVRIAAEFHARGGTYGASFRVTDSIWTGQTRFSLELRASNGTAQCSVEYMSGSLASATVSCSEMDP